MTTVRKVFPYSGAQQTWSVPNLVTSALFELWGAPGGFYVAGGPFGGVGTANGVSGATGSYASSGNYSQASIEARANRKGLVGFVSGTLPLTPGAQYAIFVGGAGGFGNADGNSAYASTTNYGPGGYNGGGRGGYSQGVVPGSIFYPGCGGGGASDIRVGGVALANRIAVAGGGGGGCAGDVATLDTSAANPISPNPPYPNTDRPGVTINNTPSYYQTSGPGYGGAGGAATGQTGGLASDATTDTVTGSGGAGGSTANLVGGAAGTASGGRHAGTAGALGVGGVGGLANGSASDFAGGGGGGGGYYGGGGGSSGVRTAVSTCIGAGGGGGSNYLSGSFVNPVNVDHVMPGADFADGVNGLVRITYLQPPNTPSVSNPTPGQYVDASAPLDVSWTFSSLVSGLVQGGFDVEYMQVGGSTWTVFSHPTAGTVNSFSIPGSTFTAGNDYYVQVRVYDQDGDVSAWTQILVHAVVVPSPPTIVTPATGSTLTTSSFNVTWTVDPGAVETMYRVQAFDDNGALQVDSGELVSTRVNICTNPSFETSTAGWTVSGGPSFAQSATFAKIGTKSGKITWATAGALTQDLLFAFTSVPGQVYTASFWYAVGTVGTDPNVTPQGLDTNGVVLNTGASTVVTTNGVFVRACVTFTATTGTSYLCLTNAASATAGQVGYVDEVLIEMGSTLLTYFDGSNANTNPGTPTWQGTTNLSRSQLTIPNVLTYAMTWPLSSQPITVAVAYGDVADQSIYSAPGASQPSVNINPPDTPVVGLSIDDDTGSATLTIDNSGSTFPAVYNDIYRQDTTHGTPEIRIVAGLPPSTNYVDYTPGTAIVYAYRVRAYSASGGFADAT